MRRLLQVYKNARRDRWIKRHFGTLSPGSTMVLGGAHPIQVDPSDNRARKILLYDKARGRQHTNQAFWFTACEVFCPTVCVDVGLNYGECLLAGQAPENAKLVGYEANPLLGKYLQATVQSHPARDRITLHFGAVSDETGRELTLAINSKWSGGSYVTDSVGNELDHDYVAVSTLTLDDTLPALNSDDRVLFKVDVEGFEAAVIRGMKNTLSQPSSMVGFVEFNPQMMQQRSSHLEEFWKTLAEHFQVHFCTGTGIARPLHAQTWSDAIAEIDQPHGDLLLLNNPSCPYQQALLERWVEKSIDSRVA